VLERPSASERPADRPEPARRTAVLLDPHPLWLDALERVLGRAGVHVAAKTSSPRAALAAVRAHRPDLFVTEIETADGELDGVAWMRRVLETMSIGKAIVLSRHEQPELIDAALRAGAVAYVIKTAHPDDLASAVRQVFDHSVFLGPAIQPSSGASELGERYGLTQRELEILQLLVEGHSNSQLAHMLWVTEQTVKFHLSNIYRKLGVANRSEASRKAQVAGLDGASPLDAS
jgi:DNA-binding NarL/FixJ family response regulator